MNGFNDLNGDLRAIAEVLGRDKTLYLVSQCPRYKVQNRQGKGQLLLYVPKLKFLTLDHNLCKILEYSDAIKLSQVFGGELLVLSHCRHIVIEHRNRGIKSMFKQGFSIDDLALFFGLSTRAISLAAKG